ncbi:NAD(P)H-hydrate dehydratase [Acidithiobacillus sp.]|uniref:NAD(P)H-hydrate dehydratase n=1 Tax=Acidithiobacillus sp. TaxID=1872118 RepID=UPI0025BCB218|nr:NAD(P)H-hydrate dehydratase [Acidithiobacillus sp.]MCK9187671.1 NAD(P)H-hydrate dehydratase [Acidithiobacillus sp.]MCK9358561.1 NAD(P)H-hydrate dehydratase [Acidithiobacillus sp.]
MNEAFVALNWRTVPALPTRSPRAHKGSFGHVFAVGGGPGMGGALALACAAAYRVGAGLVTAIGHPSAIPYLAAQLPEATWRDWPARFDNLSDQSVLAVGPGLGQGLAAHDLLLEIGTLSCPQIWDADALNILARFGPELLVADAVRLFTPHPGEAARLLGGTVAAVQADRAAAICRLQARYGGHWVLKGHHSLLLGSSGHWFCPLGNPGMATGGSGDVLTGILAGLLAQDLDPDKALSLGVCLHARAGDLAAAQMGEASLLARDILAAVPRALQELTRNHDGS